MKKLSLTLLSLLSLQVMTPLTSTVVYAHEITTEVIIENTAPQENPGIQTRDGGITVFLGGMLVAWVIDGSIEYVTGKAPSTWGAEGLQNIEQHILEQAKNGKTRIIIPEAGAFTCPGVVIDHSGMCQ